MFTSIRMYIYVAIGVAILSVATYLVYEYNKTKKDLAVEESNNRVLRDANAMQKDTIDNAVNTIDKWQKSQDDLVKTVKDMQDNSEKSDKRVEELKAFYAKHDLQTISSKHPSLVEDAINRGTQQSICLLVISTGGQDRSCTDTIKTATAKSKSATSAAHTIPAGKVDSYNAGQPAQR